MSQDSAVLLAFTVCLLAGLATSVGGLLALHPVMRGRAALGMALAFAAGAMVAISLVEIVPRSLAELSGQLSGTVAAMATAAAFGLGVLVVLGIDRMLPRSLNPADIAGEEHRLSTADLAHNVRLMRSAVLVAGIVALHNFPEGLSTFLATLADPRLGVTLAVAVAIHNIPEGIAVAAPVYAATGSRTRALWWATFSGLAEPLGALVGLVLLRAVLPTELFTLTFGLIAGMMVTISLRELVPTAIRYHRHPAHTIAGLTLGAAVMLVSLAMLR